MTKQHFEAFAREIRDSGLSDAERRAAAHIVIEVARQFNGRFDVARFKRAAGIDAPKEVEVYA